MAAYQTYGNTWWGSRWLSALNSIDMTNRLSRGRSYLAQGRLSDLAFHPDNCSITCNVHGTAYYPYEVEFGQKPLAPTHVKRLVDDIARDPDIVAALLDGELPPEILERAEALKIELFPTSSRSLHVSCTCPDAERICKHAAAGIYAVSVAIDHDPFLVFRLRGIDLKTELKTRGIDLERAVTVKAPTLKEVLTRMTADMELPNPKPAAELSPEEEAEALKKLRTLPYASVEPMGDRIFSLLTPKMLLSSRKDFPEWLAKTLARAAKDLRKLEAASEKAGERGINADENRPPAPIIRLVPKTSARFTACVDGQPEDRGLILRASDFLSYSRRDVQEYRAEAELWFEVVQCALRLMSVGALMPIVVRDEGRIEAPGETDSEDTAELAPVLFWMPVMREASVRRLITQLAQGAGPWLDCVFEDKADDSAHGPVAKMLLLTALAANALIASHQLILSNIAPKDYADALFTGLDLLEDARAPWGNEEAETLARWLKPFLLGDLFPWVPVLTVRSRPASEGGDVTVNFGILPHGAAPGTMPTPLSKLLTEPERTADRFAALSCLKTLAAAAPVLDGIRTSGGKPIRLEGGALKDFLFDWAPHLKLLGVQVMLPERLRKLLRPQLVASFGAGSDAGGAAGGMLTKETLSDFQWKAALGSATLTEAQLRELALHAGEVVRLGDDFVYVDPAELEKIAKTVADGAEPSFLEKMRGVLTGELDGARVDAAPEIEERIRALTAVPEVPPPEALHATLRPYQARGYAWLMKNIKLGLGALIADDMGLGKTIQVISALTALKAEGALEKHKVLVVVPTTLLANWVREIGKFSGNLTVGVHHGANRKLPAAADLPDVTLTSYGTLRRDAEAFSAYRWRLLVLDEAQVIKNRNTAQSLAVHSVKAPQVIAMSGTPVENRLMEYWSILSTVQPKLLGSESDFRKTFAVPIERDHDAGAVEAFRRLTAPFMLRRLKSDPKIISDLPERNILDHFTPLTPEQAGLYRKTLDMLLDKIAEAEAEEKALPANSADPAQEAAPDGTGGKGESARMKRRGLVLKLITSLKQICNSPSQYLKTDAPAADSGKGEALLEILGQCRDAQRKVLVFTQFREMGERLQNWIEGAGFGRPAFLHGGVSVKERMAMVDRFQTDRTNRIMIISLKAGGTGLNLTAASAVIHYDLWWNPAVEAQATDRAYRIGQRRDVLVYRFVTAGTFEEKVNAMLARKRELAELTVNTGETWIGDLPAADIREIFRLDETAAAV